MLFKRFLRLWQSPLSQSKFGSAKAKLCIAVLQTMPYHQYRYTKFFVCGWRNSFQYLPILTPYNIYDERNTWLTGRRMLYITSSFRPPNITNVA